MIKSDDFDPVLFRDHFPIFADQRSFPDQVLAAQWALAGQMFTETDHQVLMTAHLAQLFALAVQGRCEEAVTHDDMDVICRAIQPPPQQSHWHWWLCQTSYGVRLYAALCARASGGRVDGAAQWAALRSMGRGLALSEGGGNA